VLSLQIELSDKGREQPSLSGALLTVFRNGCGTIAERGLARPPVLLGCSRRGAPPRVYAGADARARL
jgi:hypothetical protein